jgi:hypothetical protein
MFRGAGYWSRRTYLLVLAFLGSLGMATVLVSLWRFRANSAANLPLGIVAILIVAVWLAFLAHQRSLEKLSRHRF